MWLWGLMIEPVARPARLAVTKTTEWSIRPHTGCLSPQPSHPRRPQSGPHSTGKHPHPATNNYPQAQPKQQNALGRERE